jgi:hypothetical protein
MKSITNIFIKGLNLGVVSRDPDTYSTIVRDQSGSTILITETVKDGNTQIPMRWFGDTGDRLIGILWGKNSDKVQHSILPEDFINILGGHNIKYKISSDRESVVIVVKE